MGYFGLFFTSFISATLFPGGSEAVLVYLLNENFSPALLLFVATIGNTLGSFVNYLLGKYAVFFALKQKYIKEASFDKAHHLFKRYGVWSLLFSWLPIIGDPLTLVAGALRYAWWKFLLIVSFAKLVRYGVVYMGFLAFI